MAARDACGIGLVVFFLTSWVMALEALAASPASTEHTPALPELLAEFSEDAMAGIDQIVFAVRKPGTDGHWYANFGHYADDENRLTYQDGGRLCRLNLRTGEVTILLEDAQGAIRDPQVDYEARRILFSYRPGGTEYYHLYEIHVDGTGLKQLTNGPYDDIEPTWLADGDIVFVSSRCRRWVNCWLTKVAVLHRCEPDGSNIRAISANLEHDNTPWPLPDGRILYHAGSMWTGRRSITTTSGRPIPTGPPRRFITATCTRAR